MNVSRYGKTELDWMEEEDWKKWNSPWREPVWDREEERGRWGLWTISLFGRHCFGLGRCGNEATFPDAETLQLLKEEEGCTCMLKHALRQTYILLTQTHSNKLSSVSAQCLSTGFKCFCVSVCRLAWSARLTKPVLLHPAPSSYVNFQAPFVSLSVLRASTSAMHVTWQSHCDTHRAMHTKERALSVLTLSAQACLCSYHQIQHHVNPLFCFST